MKYYTIIHDGDKERITPYDNKLDAELLAIILYGKDNYELIEVNSEENPNN